MARPIHCEQARSHFEELLLDTIDERHRARLQRHLRECTACREALEQTRARMAKLHVLPPEAAPPGLADRTLARLREAARAPFAGSGRPWVRPVFASFLVAVVAIAVLMPIWRRYEESARRASTQGNMKQLALMFKMYADQSGSSSWPRLAPHEDAWAPDLDALRAIGFVNPEPLLSEQHPDVARLRRELERAWRHAESDFSEVERLMGESYGYLGYTVSNEAEFDALRKARDGGLLGDGSESLAVPGLAKAIAPLREGVERFLITDINNPGASATAQSTIPVLVEIASWKHKHSVASYDGASVSYMDGHVAFVPYGTFPVLPAILDALSGIQTVAPE